MLRKGFRKSRLPLSLEQLESRSLPSLFAPAVNYPVGNNPYSVAVGDFNQDGALDLAIANKNSNNVGILLGNGDGTFRPGGAFQTDSTPIFIVAADLNHDGKLDLVTGNNSSNDISVLLGNGDGTFQTAVNYATGSETVGVAVGDFNKDGILDLAVASQGAGEVFVLLGNGDGTFKPAVAYACGTFAREVAVGDFNADGKLDLVVANQGENTVSVLLGNGDGTFQPGVKYATGPDPTSIKVGDFRGNGILDIVTANFDFAGGTGTVSVMLGNGDGTFQAAENYTTDLHAHSVALADFNADGHLDIAVANNGSDDISILLGNGDGTFQASQNFAAGSVPLSVAAGDFNAKGVQSLAVANGASNNVSILINNTPVLTPSSIAEGSGDFTLTAKGGPFSTNSTVEWNGTPLPTTFISPSELQAAVPAADVVDEGTANVSVTGLATGPLQFSILDNDALSATGYNLSGFEGQQVNGIAATFTDATYPTNSPNDFTTTIDWGDGSTSAGTVTVQGNLFVVRGVHTYAEKGSYSISVGIKDDDSGVASATTASTATIADSPLSATGTPITATEFQVFHPKQVATFTDANPNASVNDFSTTIDWGNGITEPGTVRSLGNGKFEVLGPGPISDPQLRLIYSEEGTFTIMTTIKDKDDSQVMATSTATVADAPLDATGTLVQAAEGVVFSGQVASFRDENPDATTEDFLSRIQPLCVNCPPVFNVQIDWGDGSLQGTGSVTQPGGFGTRFVVTSSHAYAKAGSYTISVTINDVGGSTATTTTTATVTDPNDIVGRVLENGQIWTGVSTGSSFNSSMWAVLDPGVTWVDPVVGDFNGDGLTDIAARDANTGKWWVGLSNGSGFTMSVWTMWSTGVTWADVQVGDFNGDGKADIVGRYVEGGQWWVALSNGSGFTNSRWDTWSTGATWVDVKVGDFNGDGKADITGRYLQGGTWWTGLSTGSSFTTTLWATWSTSVTWVDVQVGDFDGDGKTDITGRALETGDWWTGISMGSSFQTGQWATWSTGVTWVDVRVGDFNGDGRTDIIGRAQETGQWWVGLSQADACSYHPPFCLHPSIDPLFNTTVWSTWSTGVTWVDVQVGDFNGDGKSDITGRALETGDWWTGLSAGSAFTTTKWATWSTGVTWTAVHTGDFA
jgi:hypothetical protein